MKDILKLFLNLTITILLFFNTHLSAQAEGNSQAPSGMPFSLSPEDIENLKASTADSPMGPITDKDIEEFVSFINNLSEEDMKALEGLAQEAAKEIEAASKQEAEISGSAQPSNEIKIEEPKKEEKPKLPANKVDEVKQVIATTIKYINDLKQEASKEESVSKRLNAWAKDLNDLIFYLSYVNNKNILIGHLLSSDFKDFYENLKKLNRSLEDNIKSFSVEDIIGGKEYEEEDPYEILGLDQDASEKEIDQAFNKIKELKDAKKVEENLKNAGVDPKEIKRQIKELKLSFNLIESAYEGLKNPKSKAQIDKEIKSKQSQGLSKKEISKRAFSKILDSLGTAFYDNKILQDFTNLLSKYDPVALETKKELDKAEAAAKKAREEAAKKTVGKSSGSRYEPDFGYSGKSDYHPSNDYARPSSSYDFPYDSGKSYGDYGDWGTQSGLKDKSIGGKSGGSVAGGSPDKTKPEEKTKTPIEKEKKEEKPKAIGEASEKSAKKDLSALEEDPIKLMQEIDANLNLITSQLENNPRIVRMLSLTHEVPPAAGDAQEKAIRRSSPLESVKDTGIVKWAGNKKTLTENQAEIDYLDTWQNNMQFEKVVEKIKTLEALIKNKLEKNKKAKKDFAKEFNRSLSGKLTGPITNLLLTVKNIKGDIKPVNNLLKNIEPIYDSLHNIRSNLAQESDIIQDIKNISEQLSPVCEKSQTAQVLDAQIKGEQSAGQELSEDASNVSSTSSKETQQDLDNILKNLEGNKTFLSQILKSIDRLSTQIQNASSASKQIYDAEWKNSIGTQIEDIEKLLKIMQNNKTQDADIRKTAGIIENITKKLKEIEKNL